MFTDASAAREFITSGNATVTLRSTVSGSHLTFKVATPKREGASRVLFVLVLCGPDSYRYIGMLGENGYFRVTTKTCPAKDATAIAAFRFCMVNLARRVIPATLEIRHIGRCGCCGRKITTPGSLDSGIGPECAAKVGMPSAKLAKTPAAKKVDPMVVEARARAEREHAATREFWHAYRAAPVSPLAGIMDRFAAVHC